ncbi:MAG: hypothetical protein JSW61_14735 [Candidatus Thorarchaeota archaeon]|nr:MAG: hypothetical protein JSW61_14735 [Candidatus Thorarchaeota archaeon]
MDSDSIRSTLTEALVNGLPPVGFSLNRSGTGLILSRFPSPNCYLSLERLPRGPLSFMVRSYRSMNHDYESLETHIERCFKNGRHAPVELGNRSTIELSGIERLAISFVTGGNVSRKKWSAALVPSPDGGPYGLLVMFGVYVGARTNPRNFDVKQHPIHKNLIQSFRLENGR